MSRTEICLKYLPTEKSRVFRLQILPTIMYMMNSPSPPLTYFKRGEQDSGSEISM